MQQSLNEKISSRIGLQNEKLSKILLLNKKRNGDKNVIIWSGKEEESSYSIEIITRFYYKFRDVMIQKMGFIVHDNKDITPSDVNIYIIKDGVETKIDSVEKKIVDEDTLLLIDYSETGPGVIKILAGSDKQEFNYVIYDLEFEDKNYLVYCSRFTNEQKDYNVTDLVMKFKMHGVLPEENPRFNMYIRSLVSHTIIADFRISYTSMSDDYTFITFMCSDKEVESLVQFSKLYASFTYKYETTSYIDTQIYFNGTFSMTLIKTIFPGDMVNGYDTEIPFNYSMSSQRFSAISFNSMSISSISVDDYLNRRYEEASFVESYRVDNQSQVVNIKPYEDLDAPDEINLFLVKFEYTVGSDIYTTGFFVERPIHRLKKVNVSLSVSEVVPFLPFYLYLDYRYYSNFSKNLYETYFQDVFIKGEVNGLETNFYYDGYKILEDDNIFRVKLSYKLLSTTVVEASAISVYYYLNNVFEVFMDLFTYLRLEFKCIFPFININMLKDGVDIKNEYIRVFFLTDEHSDSVFRFESTVSGGTKEMSLLSDFDKKLLFFDNRYYLSEYKFLNEVTSATMWGQYKAIVKFNSEVFDTTYRPLVLKKIYFFGSTDLNLDDSGFVIYLDYYLYSEDSNNTITNISNARFKGIYNENGVKQRVTINLTSEFTTVDAYKRLTLRWSNSYDPRQSESQTDFSKFRYRLFGTIRFKAGGTIYNMEDSLLYENEFHVLNGPLESV